MFRAMIPLIFRSTRLCVTACGLVHPRCCRPIPWEWRNWSVPPLPGYRPATSWVHYTTSCNTQSSAPEDGRDHRPKHVELIGITNKPLLLHLIGCLYYFINDAPSSKYQRKVHFADSAVHVRFKPEISLTNRHIIYLLFILMVFFATQIAQK